jgi:hypothetical protein
MFESGCDGGDGSGSEFFKGQKAVVAASPSDAQMGNNMFSPPRECKY